MVEILRDELAKLETKNLYVLFQSLSDLFLIILLLLSITSFLFLLSASPLMNTCLCDYRRLLGKDLTGLSLVELQNLEKQLNEGLLSVKERKVLA